MNNKTIKFGLAAAAALAASACGGGGDGTVLTNPPPAGTGSATQALDTQQVLAQASVTSETSSPFAVVNGALTLTDTAEDTDPIAVDSP